MGFPPYLIGVGIPLLVGLLGIGYFIFSQGSTRPKYEPNYTYRYHEDTSRYDYSTDDNEDVCSICLENMNKSNSTPLNCGHELHASCLVELVKRQQNKCPQCRANITY